MRYEAGQNVGPGFYVSLKGDQINVGEGTQVLPGEPGTRFFRVPWAAMLLLAPALGGVFVMFLPVIGIVLTAQVAAQAVGRKFAGVAKDMAHVAVPPEMAGQAALIKPDAKAEKHAEHAEPKAEEKALADEVAARREKGEK